MNKIKAIFSGQPWGLTLLGTLLASILLLGLGLAIAVLVWSSLDRNLFLKDFCLSRECVVFYMGAVDQSLLIAKATFDLGVAVATMGGIFVALVSYFNTSGNAALANHIEHLKVFCEYLDSEIKKKDKLSDQLIDSLLLYGFIFNQSRNGRTTVSQEFKDLIAGLNNIIAKSNDICKAGASKGFDYREHQRRVRDHLAPVGVRLYIAPRNDYFEMEQQLFSLLHRISQSFCAPGSLPTLTPREYY